MSGSAPTEINFNDIQVDHGETVVYKKEAKKVQLAPWQQAQLKPATGGKTRTFKGGTVVTSSSSGPTIVKKEPSITPAAQSGEPKITITAATHADAPKRIAQPVGTVASEPVAYVPESRLYQPKKDDKSYLKQDEESEAPESTPETEPTPEPVADPSPPPPPAPAPPVPAPAPAPAVPSSETQAAGATEIGTTGAVATTATSTEKIVGDTGTTKTTVTTTTVEENSCCSIL